MSQLDLNRKKRYDFASIPSSYSRLLGRILELKKSELHRLLDRTGVSHQTFLDESSLLTAEQQIAIIKNTIRLSPDEAIGLEIGKHLSPHTHGTMGLLMINSPSVLTVINSLKEYMPTRFWLVNISDDMSDHYVEYTVNFDLWLEERVYQCCSEMAATVLFELIKLVLGREPTEIKVEFAHPQPDYRQRYDEIFSCPISFDAPALKFTIPMGMLYERNILADHESYKLALSQCQALLAKINLGNSSYKAQVQKILLSQSLGSMSVDDAAASLFMSRRTLARKLLDEGTTFKQIKEDMLSEQAASYLLETGLSTEAIAAMLNYHDSSSFRRTFKRWYKMTPSEYRQRHASL